jgi:hypothetical protein
MTFDPSSDFADVIDASESVTLNRRGSTPGGAGETVDKALRRAVTVAEAAKSGGKYTASDVTWHISCAQLNARPRLGDVITDGDGGRWTVLDVRLVTMNSRWQCSTRNLAVVYALNDTLTVLKAVYSKGTAGAAEATWRAWRTGVRARIQPLETTVEVKGSARTVANRCTIFIEDDLSLDHTHRIKAADGTIYRITKLSGVEQIGELPAIEAVSLAK